MKLCRINKRYTRQQIWPTWKNKCCGGLGGMRYIVEWSHRSEMTPWRGPRNRKYYSDRLFMRTTAGADEGQGQAGWKLTKGLWLGWLQSKAVVELVVRFSSRSDEFGEGRGATNWIELSNSQNEQLHLNIICCIILSAQRPNTYIKCDTFIQFEIWSDPPLKWSEELNAL
jgi:hypothetical protein